MFTVPVPPAPPLSFPTGVPPVLDVNPFISSYLVFVIIPSWSIPVPWFVNIFIEPPPDPPPYVDFPTDPNTWIVPSFLYSFA